MIKIEKEYDLNSKHTVCLEVGEVLTLKEEFNGDAFISNINGECDGSYKEIEYATPFKLETILSGQGPYKTCTIYEENFDTWFVITISKNKVILAATDSKAHNIKVFVDLLPYKK